MKIPMSNTCCTHQHILLRNLLTLIIAVCGTICGAEGWGGIEEFGKAKEAWFNEVLQLPNGIPSHDPFGRVFALISAGSILYRFPRGRVLAAFSSMFRTEMRLGICSFILAMAIRSG